MIEPPAPTSSRPAPTVQRRSNPVNGSVLAPAFAGCVDVPGALLVVAGETVLAGVVLAGVVGDFVDFDGEVPLPGSEPLPGFVGGGGALLGP
jgi:hypothetical protein